MLNIPVLIAIISYILSECGVTPEVPQTDDNHTSSSMPSLDIRKSREVLVKYHPFLRHIRLTRSMQSLLSNTFRHKRGINVSTRKRRKPLEPVEIIPLGDSGNSLLFIDKSRKELSTTTTVDSIKDLVQRSGGNYQNLDIVPIAVIRNASPKTESTTLTTTTTVFTNGGFPGNNVFTQIQEIPQMAPAQNDAGPDFSQMMNPMFNMNGQQLIPAMIPAPPGYYGPPAVSSPGSEEGYTSLPSIPEETDDAIKSGRSNQDNSFPQFIEAPNKNDVLKNILETVEEIRDNGGGHNEDMQCQIAGSWISKAAQVIFDVSMSDNGTFNVELQNCTPSKAPETTFLSDTNWKIGGKIPFPRSDMVMLTGIHNREKKLIVFVGECRTCSGIETVTGQWLVSRLSRDCRDQRASQELVGDLWRRESLHSLRQEKLSHLKLYNSSGNTDTVTLPSSTSMGTTLVDNKTCT